MCSPPCTTAFLVFHQPKNTGKQALTKITSYSEAYQAILSTPTNTARVLHIETHQRALHCFADFRTSSEEIRAHWLSPYFITAALRISSCRCKGIQRGTGGLSPSRSPHVQQRLKAYLRVLPDTTLYHNPHGAECLRKMARGVTNRVPFRSTASPQSSHATEI